MNEEFMEKNFESKKLNVEIKRPMVQFISDIVYDQVSNFSSSNVALKMDLLVPHSREEKPAVVFITGGGFLAANKDNYIQQRLDLAEAGYLVASIEYGVAPQVTFPQPLLDLKSAIRFLKVHADKFNINPDKIGVMGDSAGGYLAAFAGTTNGIKEFEKGVNLEVNSNVQAVVDIYGLSDLSKIGSDYTEEIQKIHMSAGAPEALLVNGVPGFGGQDGGILADKEKVEAANPISYISSQTPPFLLMHGSNDSLVSPSQTEILHQALIEKGVDSTRYIVEGAEHGGDHWQQQEIMDIIITFFDKYLK
ncbi:alpha/beta hydrolase fold domain-containing protein [Natronospora cellulosivora (SeqCode)]